jgi:hypothetical protein
MNIFFKLLSNDKVQRILYSIALLFWLILWINDWERNDSISSMGIKYFWLGLFPTLLLVLQVLFNNQYAWLSILSLFLLYTILTVYNLFLMIMVDSERMYVKGVYINFEQILSLVFIVIILTLINLVLFKMKPNN